jgi:hypothetical protein
VHCELMVSCKACVVPDSEVHLCDRIFFLEYIQILALRWTPVMLSRLITGFSCME